MTLKNNNKPNAAIIFVLVFSGIGAYLLLGSHAATPYSSITADKGSLSNGATSQTCSGASDGNCVSFCPPIPKDGNVDLALCNAGTPFAASSFWNTPIPNNAPISPNSAAYINNIINQLCYPYGATQPGPCTNSNPEGVLETNRWSVPFYVVPANQPCVPIVLNPQSSSTGGINLTTLLSQGSGSCHGVPIPANAVPAGGTDAHLAVYQPSSNTLWEFWQLSTPAQNAPGAGPLPWNAPSYSDSRWHAVWGGVMYSVSQSDGITQTNPNLPSAFAGWASGLPLIGSIVRIEELQAGQIDHAIGLSLDNNLSKNVIPADNCPTSSPVNTPGATNGISWPADSTDGNSTDPCAIPEGQRFRLNPNLNLNTLNLTPVARAIAVAAQKYGFVVNQTGGPNIGIDLGDPTPYTTAGLANPYTSGPGVGGVGNNGIFNGLTQDSQIMANFPWDQLQALPFSYGQ